MSNWHDAFSLVIIMVPVVGAMSFAPLWGPRLVLRGITRPTDTERRPFRFRLCDLLCLFVYFSAANGFWPLLLQEVSRPHALFITVLANILATCMWLLGVSLLERNDVDTAGCRTFYHLILHPLVIFAPSAIVTGGALLASSLEVLEKGLRPGIAEFVSSPLVHALMSIVVLGSICCLLARWLGARIFARKPETQ